MKEEILSVALDISIRFLILSVTTDKIRFYIPISHPQKFSEPPTTPKF